MADNPKDGSTSSKPIEKRYLKSSTPLNLYKLPPHIFDIVTVNLPLRDCLSLRKVSRDLRDLVNSSKMHCGTIDFWFGERYARMVLDDSELDYNMDTATGGCGVSLKRDTKKAKIDLDNRHFTQRMFDDAATFLKNPKFEVDLIRFDAAGKTTALKFLNFLKSLNHRLNVRSIACKDLEFLCSIQEFLRPEKFDKMLYDHVDGVTEFIKIAETHPEILKTPKLKIRRFTFSRYSFESAAKFSEIFKSIKCQFHIQSIIVDDGRWMPSILRLLNPEKVEGVMIDKYAALTVDRFHEISGSKQWKSRTRLEWCVPAGIGFEGLKDFKEILCNNFELTDENLVIIRDILLKSPHLDVFILHRYRQRIRGEDIEDVISERSENFDRIMSVDTAYDSSTRRFSIPNSQDYFQLELDCYEIQLTIKRVSP